VLVPCARIGKLVTCSGTLSNINCLLSSIACTMTSDNIELVPAQAFRSQIEGLDDQKYDDKAKQQSQRPLSRLRSRA
jgi:hypothetical protein